MPSAPHSTRKDPAIRTEKRTFGGVFTPYRVRFLVGVVWLLLTNAMALSLPRLLNRGVEGLRAGIPTPDMIHIAMMMAGAAVVLGITRVASRTYIFNVGRDVEYDLRRDLYAHLGAQPPAFYDSRPVGDLMSRVTNDLSNVRLLFGFATLNVVNTLVIYLGNIPLLFSIDAPLAMAALLPYPVVFVAARVVASRVFGMTRQNQEDLGKVSTKVQEHLSGLSVVRAFSQQDAEVSRFNDVNNMYYTSSCLLYTSPSPRD